MIRGSRRPSFPLRDVLCERGSRDRLCRSCLRGGVHPLDCHKEPLPMIERDDLCTEEATAQQNIGLSAAAGTMTLSYQRETALRAVLEMVRGTPLATEW